MTEKIEVQDQEQLEKPGACVAMALVGVAHDLFEIYVDATLPGRADYYVNHVPVSREVYHDAMVTAGRDRGMPDMDDDEAEQVEVEVS